MNREKNVNFRLPKSWLFLPYIPYCYLRHFTADLRQLFTFPFTVYYFSLFLSGPIQTRIVGFINQHEAQLEAYQTAKEAWS